MAQPVATISGVPERPSQSSGGPHQVDAVGQAILGLLQKASRITEANNQRAMEVADELSHRLHAAEEQIASLQSQVQFYRERSERAEKWLRRIHDEIDRQFIQHPK